MERTLGVTAERLIDLFNDAIAAAEGDEDGKFVTVTELCEICAIDFKNRYQRDKILKILHLIDGAGALDVKRVRRTNLARIGSTSPGYAMKAEYAEDDNLRRQLIEFVKSNI